MRHLLMLTALLACMNTHAADFKRTLKLAESGDMNAQFNLGTMYQEGDVIPENDSKASLWFRRAALQGHTEAAYRVGVLYDEGRSIQESDVKAVKWWSMAAEKGHALAQYNLGLMYRSGAGVTANAALALKWYSKAAAQGQVNAQYNLAHMYYKGIGIPENFVRSYVWFSMVKTQGVREAAPYMKSLRAMMTLEQMGEAQALATRCYESNLNDCESNGERPSVPRKPSSQKLNM